MSYLLSTLHAYVFLINGNCWPLIHYLEWTIKIQTLEFNLSLLSPPFTLGSIIR